MRPGRANLRAAGGGAAGGGAPADAPAAAPSAEYNNRLCLESRYAASLALVRIRVRVRVGVSRSGAMRGTATPSTGRTSTGYYTSGGRGYYAGGRCAP